MIFMHQGDSICIADYILSYR